MSATKNSVQLQEVGIDYITATSHCGASTRHLCAFAEWLVSQEIQKGCRNGPWRNTGYSGRHAGSVCFGVSQQGGIVRASGQVSRDHWGQLLSLADNVTRLDVQVTLPSVPQPAATLSLHHEQLRTAPRFRGKPLKYHAHYGPSGCEGVTVGRRVSDRYGRAYDKGVETGLPEYAGCLRYELELHRSLAYRTACAIDSQERDQLMMAQLVRTFFTDRGITLADIWILPWDSADIVSDDGEDGLLIPRSAGRPPDVTRALRWMHNSVRPAIKRLLEAGYQVEVFRALELSVNDRIPSQVCDFPDKDLMN